MKAMFATVAWLATVVTVSSSIAFGADGVIATSSSTSSLCTTTVTITRATLASCALSASLATKSEQLALSSFEGRRTAAGLLLPSNPSIALGGGYTIDPSITAAQRQFVWSATVSQEIEIAGQRGRRLETVKAEERAQSSRLELVRREAISTAWLTYFDALAAVEEARIASRLGALAVALKTVAKARAQVGVSSDLDAHLAESAATRFAQAQLGAEQRVTTSFAALAAIVGIDPSLMMKSPSSLHLEGDLVPLNVAEAELKEPSALVESATAKRTEIVAALSERDAFTSRAALYERLRIPNPTLSVFVRNDWIGERSAGVGIGFPLPLPSPIGRTFAGEIAEARILAERAGTEAERARRKIRVEVVSALQVYAARKTQLALYRQEQVREAETTLRSIAEELEARRLPIRDALISQQGLIDLLVGHIEAKRAVCAASVELARAAGLPLDRGAL